MNEELTLTIVRGWPGTGKTTLANKLAAENDWVHAEADQWFERTGQYIFDHTQLQQAHDFCRRKVIEALGQGKSVVVSNTFTRHWEYAIYEEIARSFGATVKIISLTKEYGSIHNVPEASMQRMRARFEP